MRVLLSNDDGYRAEGLQALERALLGQAEIMIVAPERNHSGASNSLTLFEPLRVTQLGSNRWYCSGTPTDCVHVAITGLLPEDPHMVFSGINHGPNLGDDVLYSGTVAAAMEARVLDVPAVAVSVAGYPPRNFESAGRAVSELFARLSRNKPPGKMLLNVNVPDLPWKEIRGFRQTRLGHRHKAARVKVSDDPYGGRLYWMGLPGHGLDAGPGTDFDALSDGWISVTPLQCDLTDHKRLEATGDWLQL